MLYYITPGRTHHIIPVCYNHTRLAKLTNFDEILDLTNLTAVLLVKNTHTRYHTKVADMLARLVLTKSSVCLMSLRSHSCVFFFKNKKNNTHDTWSYMCHLRYVKSDETTDFLLWQNLTAVDKHAQVKDVPCVNLTRRPRGKSSASTLVLECYMPSNAYRLQFTEVSKLLCTKTRIELKHGTAVPWYRLQNCARYNRNTRSVSMWNRPSSCVSNFQPDRRDPYVPPCTYRM